MWYKYLENKIYEDLDLIEGLATIDEKIEGTNSIQDIISFLENNENTTIYEDDTKNMNFIHDGDTKTLIILLNDLINKKYQLTIQRENLAINKWIVFTYQDFINENNLQENAITFSNTFPNDLDSIVVGESSFVNELKNNLINLKKCIDTTNI